MRKYILGSVFIISSLLLVLAVAAGTASAHGTAIDYQVKMAVEINAAFDSGDPMSNAQVTVYAPNDPATAWLTGTADENGHFVFTPDPEITGMWDVSVRTAGHGEMLHIPLEEGTVAVSNSGTGGFSLAQIILMSVAVIWGFVGTALYFSGNKAPASASKPQPGEA